MRDMPFLYNCAASTSHYCTRVNGPCELEELPPDWTPDSAVVPDLSDALPFENRRFASAAAVLAIVAMSACNKHNLPQPGPIRVKSRFSAQGNFTV
jgi:hypothetical protein